MNIGDTFRAKLGNSKPYKIHIMAIVDEYKIVFKFYGRYKQWWHYEVMDRRDLQNRIEMAANKVGES